MWGGAEYRGVWRQVCLTLVLCAVALRVMIPAGFMVDRLNNDLPFALVLCTGEGALVVEPGQALPDHRDPDDTAKVDHTPCVFAGHGLALDPPERFDVQPTEFAQYSGVLSKTTNFGVSPGRGRPAPPLPARGPPDLTT